MKIPAFARNLWEKIHPPKTSGPKNFLEHTVDEAKKDKRTHTMLTIGHIALQVLGWDAAVAGVACFVALEAVTFPVGIAFAGLAAAVVVAAASFFGWKKLKKSADDSAVKCGGDLMTLMTEHRGTIPANDKQMVSLAKSLGAKTRRLELVWPDSFTPKQRGSGDTAAPPLTPAELQSFIDNLSTYSPKLESLTLQGVAFADKLSLKPLNNMRLKEIAFNNCGIQDSHLEEIKELKKVKKLRLNQCPNVTSKGIEALGKWPLEELELRDTALKKEKEKSGKAIEIGADDIAFLASFKKLKSLSITYLNDGALEKGVPQAKNLQCLTIPHSSHIEGKGFKGLAPMQSLSSMTLGSLPSLKSDAIKELTQLHYLDTVQFNSDPEATATDKKGYSDAAKTFRQHFDADDPKNSALKGPWHKA